MISSPQGEEGFAFLSPRNGGLTLTSKHTAIFLKSDFKATVPISFIKIFSQSNFNSQLVMLTDSDQTFGVSECQTLDLPLAGLASPRSLTLMSLGQILASMLLLLLGFDGGLPGLYGILRVANQCCITHFQIAQVNIRVWYIYNIFLTCVLLRNTWLVTTGEAIILSNTISGRAYIAAAFRSVCVTSFALCQAFRSGFSNLNKSAQRRHVIMSHFKDTSTNNVHKTSKNWESKRFPKVERKCVRICQDMSAYHIKSLYSIQ